MRCSSLFLIIIASSLKAQTPTEVLNAIQPSWITP